MRRNMRMRRTAFAVVLAALMMNAASAFADFYEFSSTASINATVGIASITSTSMNSPGTITLTTTNGNVLRITANQRSTVASHLNGNPSPFGANANFGSIGAVASAVTVDTIIVGFTYTITLTDFPAANTPLANPNGTGSVTFTGQLAGTIGGASVNLQVRNFAPVPSTPGSPPQGSVIIPGGDNYVAFPYSATPPDGLIDGVLSTSFTVPEPGALTLLGLASLALTRPHRRRGG